MSRKKIFIMLAIAAVVAIVVYLIIRHRKGQKLYTTTSDPSVIKVRSFGRITGGFDDIDPIDRNGIGKLLESLQSRSNVVKQPAVGGVGGGVSTGGSTPVVIPPVVPRGGGTGGSGEAGGGAGA